jgi:gas vesicle protein
MMIGRARTAIKFFVYGLVGGLLFAPRSGAETRRELQNWVMSTVQDTMKNVSGGGGGGTSSTANSGSGSSDISQS